MTSKLQPHKATHESPGPGVCKRWFPKGGSSLARGATTFGNRPNTVSGSTVSNTELSEFFGAH